ncbi:transposable element Tcb2 transposase [Trichonephila clavipes]|nr:transposable element Tcb2 transposase [Trichonephila clavipes]
MQLLPWSAYSPNMSPLEHVWDLVGRRLTRDSRSAVSKDELLLRIQAISNSLPLANIQNLFDSMKFVHHFIAVKFDMRWDPLKMDTIVQRCMFQLECQLKFAANSKPLVKVVNGYRDPNVEELISRKNRWNPGILTITNRSVSNSECGPVCDLKNVAEVSKNGRCYPTTSIRSTSRVTTPRQDRYLIISAGRQRGSTARALGSALTVAPGIRISRQTVYRRLNHVGLDESQFSLSSDSWRVTIWRERGTRFVPRNKKERHHYPSRGVMVWAGIMIDGRTDLHFFDTGSMTAQRSRDEVLEPYVRLFRGAVSPDFIFMDDNASCHRVVLIDDFLETENIQRMSWPANSPDFNPIEHVWDMLGRQMETLSHPQAPLQN